jgi:hypothetical protein
MRAVASIQAVAAHVPGREPAWARNAIRVYGEVERIVRLAPDERTRVARAILEESLATALDPLLVVAVIHVESRFDPQAVSPAGALGLMQLMPPTMREEVARSGLAHGNPLDPVANVRAGVRYLARLVEAFDDLELALVAYNAGPTRLRGDLRAGGIPRRLLAYPRAVLGRLADLSPAAHRSVAAGRAKQSVRLAAAHASGGKATPAAPWLGAGPIAAHAASSDAPLLAGSFAWATGSAMSRLTHGRRDLLAAREERGGADVRPVARRSRHGRRDDSPSLPLGGDQAGQLTPLLGIRDRRMASEAGLA